jgi:hypothetical protein
LASMAIVFYFRRMLEAGTVATGLALIDLAGS